MYFYYYMLNRHSVMNNSSPSFSFTSESLIIQDWGRLKSRQGCNVLLKFKFDHNLLNKLCMQANYQ